jgi:hypothetical protein
MVARAVDILSQLATKCDGVAQARSIFVTRALSGIHVAYAQMRMVLCWRIDFAKLRRGARAWINALASKHATGRAGRITNCS